MKDRIVQFLRENNLTSTKFADIIGVQRSSISHILSGRNKPSFDFIEKMLLVYPALNAQWLITGKGSMFNNQPSLFSENTNLPPQNLTLREFNIQNKDDNRSIIKDSAEENEKSELKEVIKKAMKEIERIMIFYDDGTFKEYKPE